MWLIHGRPVAESGPAAALRRVAADYDERLALHERVAASLLLQGRAGLRHGLPDDPAGAERVLPGVQCIPRAQGTLVALSQDHWERHAPGQHDVLVAVRLHELRPPRCLAALGPWYHGTWWPRA